MDFSTEFVAFRDRMIAGQDKTFVTEMNVQVAGRAAAAVSCFGLDGERKLLGLVPLGSKAMRMNTACSLPPPNWTGSRCRSGGSMPRRLSESL